MSTPALVDFPWQILPKVELHAHLTGSISRRCLHGIWQSKQRAGLTTLIDPLEAMPESKTDYNLDTFFPLFTSYIYGLLDDLVSVRISTIGVLQEFQADGVAYLELRTTPRQSRNFSRKEYIACIIRVIQQWNDGQVAEYGDKTAGMRVRLILSIDRRDTTEEAAETIDLAIENKGVVVGVDLCGTPTVRRGKEIAFFTPYMERAREAGLGIVVHFAEVKHDTVCTAESSIKKEIAQDGKPKVQPILPGGRVTAEEQKKEREAKELWKHQRRCSMRKGELERMTIAYERETNLERKELLEKRIHQLCVDDYQATTGRDPDLKPGEYMKEFRAVLDKSEELDKETPEEKKARHNTEDEEHMIMLSWKPKRLGHVVYVSPRIVAEISDRKDELVLEMCVTCNIKASMTRSPVPSQHHLLSWWLDGANLTLGTDDWGIFGSPLSHEYELVAKTFLFSPQEVVELTRMALYGILGPEEDKEWLSRYLWTDRHVEKGVDGQLKGASRLEVRANVKHPMAVARLEVPKKKLAEIDAEVERERKEREEKERVEKEKAEVERATKISSGSGTGAGFGTMRVWRV